MFAGKIVAFYAAKIKFYFIALILRTVKKVNHRSLKENKPLNLMSH